MNEIKGVKVAGGVYSLNDEIVRAALKDLKEQLGDGSFVVRLANAVKAGAITLDMLDENLKLSASVVDDLETADVLKPLSANQGKVLKELIDIINGTGEGSTDKKITDAIAKLVDNAPENLDTLKEFAEWIEGHGKEVADILVAINSNTRAIADETARATEAEAGLGEHVSQIEEDVNRTNTDLAETKKNIASSLHASSSADSVNITGKSSVGRTTFSAVIPAATTETAGVMSAEDKAFLESEAKVVVCEESKQLPEEVAEINITNSKDEIVHTITEEEANFKNLKSNGREVLTNFDEVEQSETEDSEECIEVVSTTNKKELLVKITKDGVAFNKLSYLDGTYIQRIWAGKVFAAYGDSLTQLNSNIGSTVVADGNVGNGWMNVVKGYFGFRKAYNRGIGGSRLGDYYEAFYDIYPNGSYVSRDEGDNTSEKSVNVRAAMCSWDRITKQFTEAIKDTIDLIFVMGGTNDFGSYFKEVDLLDDGYPEWSAENVKDTAWMSAEENYEKGDFDITTYSGAVCSLILKLQRWMPQARIVMLTPPTYHTSGYVDGEITWVTDQKGNNNHGIPQIAMTEVVKKLATYMGVPCIDTHGGCGINVFNGHLWLVDRTHFNNINYVDTSTGRVYKNGGSNFGRAVVGGMLGIFPVSWNQYSDNGKDLNNN